MADKASKCCCCPACKADTTCCCACKTLCITLDVADGADCCCTGQNIRVEWDAGEQAYVGSIACGDLSIDLRYFFQRDEDGCFFKLRSDALGYPEGYEYRWDTAYDVSCETLVTEIPVDLSNAGGYCTAATLSTECVTKFLATCCRSCKCLPEFLSIVVDICGPGVPGRCHGLLQWSDYTHGWAGDVTCANGDTHDVTVTLRALCLFDQTVESDADGGRAVVYVDGYPPGDEPCELPEDDPDCTERSPCVAVIEIPSLDFAQWYELPAGCTGFGTLAFDVSGTTGVTITDGPCPGGDACDCVSATNDRPVMDLLLEGCPDPNCYECCDQYALLDRDAALPAGVTDPGAPCGHYWGTASVWCADTEDYVEKGILVWCDGADWQGEEYCRNEGDTAWELFGSLNINSFCPDDWQPLFSTTLNDCCCEGETDCCCDPIIPPNTLTATFYSGGCGGVVVGSFTITKSGDVWSGSGTVDGLDASLTMQCVDLGGGNCQYSVTLDCGSGAEGLSQLSLFCDPFEYTSTSLSLCGSANCLIITE